MTTTKKITIAAGVLALLWLLRPRVQVNGTSATTTPRANWPAPAGWPGFPYVLNYGATPPFVPIGGGNTPKME